MAIEINNFIVVGCKIDTLKISTQTRKRNCKCGDVLGDMPNIENAKFCPNCGVKAWINNGSQYVDGYNIENDTFAGFQVLYTNSENDVEQCWIANEIIQLEDSKKLFSGFTNLILIESEMKEVLKKAGLWENDCFGIWFVQHQVYVSSHC